MQASVDVKTDDRQLIKLHHIHIYVLFTFKQTRKKQSEMLRSNMTPS